MHPLCTAPEQLKAKLTVLKKRNRAPQGKNEIILNTHAISKQPRAAHSEPERLCKGQSYSCVLISACSGNPGPPPAWIACFPIYAVCYCPGLDSEQFSCLQILWASREADLLSDPGWSFPSTVLWIPQWSQPLGLNPTFPAHKKKKKNNNKSI